jgi:hypothetical protein
MTSSAADCGVVFDVEAVADGVVPLVDVGVGGGPI